MIRNGFARAVLPALLLLLAACQESTPAQDKSASQKAPPPTPVTVATVIDETISEWREYTGRLQAPENVELRPRVSGYIEKVVMQEGKLVKAGDLLFTIDDRQFRAEVDRLNADLKSAQARLKLAQSDLNRAQSLRRQNAISEEQVESRSADLEQAQANVESIRAALEVARLNLSYTQVTAPISGKISRAQVTAGNYVTAGQTMLTSLVSIDRMYAYFDVDEYTYLNFQSQGDHSGSSVLMELSNEEGYPHVGTMDFVDNQINAQTGTIRVRAVFDNADGGFTPGLFVRLKVVGSDQYDAILIDDRAVGTDLSNKFVLVVGEENKLEYRRIILGPKVNGLRIVREGLQPGERIVTKGLQRVFPGSQVQPEEEPMADEQTLNSLRADSALARDPVARVESGNEDKG